MEWIVEAETLSDFIDHGRYTITSKPLNRCKDCKNWDATWQNDYAPNYYYCPMIDGTRRSDFYCADAERRTDERSDQQTGGNRYT